MKRKAKAKKPVGPYNSSHIGRCSCVFDRHNLLLRVLPNMDAAEKWCAKHFADDPSSVKVMRYGSKKSILNEFDNQMQIGLTSRREIADLLWYGGVSSDLTKPKRSPTQ